MSRSLLFLSVFLVSSSVFGATFTSIASAGWNAPSTWSFVGVDANGIPDSDDDVTIATGNSVTLSGSSSCRDLIVSTGSTLNYASNRLDVFGDFQRDGTTTGVGTFYFYANPGTISAVGTYGNAGNWNFVSGSVYTIAAGTIINKINYIYVQTNAQLTNLGSINLPAGSVALAGWGTYYNGTNSYLLIAQPLSGTNFGFSASGNTVCYHGPSTPTILHRIYHHLQLTSNTAVTKTWSGPNLNLNGNLIIGTNVTLDCANQNIRLAGNWTNTASTNCSNMATVEFTRTSGLQTISRTGPIEVMNHVLISGAATVRLACQLVARGNITINAGTFDVSSSNYAVNTQGNFTNNATFNARQGTLTLNGSIPQVISGTSVTSFYNLTGGNAVAISVTSPQQVTNILTVNTGSFGVSGSGSMTLVASGPTTSARIAPLGLGTGLFGTAWIIQTYIHGPATGYWQYLGSPTMSSTLADWDGDTRFYMSGVGGNDGNACCPIFRSVRTYGEISNTYSNVTSTATTLTPGRGYMVWMSDNMTSGLTSPLIYDTRGTPNQLNVDRAVTAGGAGGGYNLVSNPYACPVTYSSVVAASSASLNASFVILQENGSYATDPNGGTIAAGQGFMCIASTSGNLTFTETCKSTVANPNVVRQMAENKIRIKVGNGVNGLGEEAVVKLTPGEDESMNLGNDLPYLPSPYEQATHIYTSNNEGAMFLLNNLGTESDHLMIPVSVITSTPGTQILTFKDLNTVTEYNCAWLEDVQTGARINLNQFDTYQFEESEMGSTRNFVLHFERTNDCSFDLQATAASLDAATNVYVSGERIFAQFEFETEEVVTISMFDLGGRMVMGETTMNVSNQTVSLETPDAHGIYLVRIQKGNEVSTKKIYY